MHGYPLEAVKMGVKHISQCSALKVIDFSVMNALKCTNSAHGG